MSEFNCSSRKPILTTGIRTRDLWLRNLDLRPLDQPAANRIMCKKIRSWTNDWLIIADFNNFTFIELRLVAAFATTSPKVAGGSASLRKTSAHAHSRTARHHRTRIFTTTHYHNLESSHLRLHLSTLHWLCNDVSYCLCRFGLRSKRSEVCT
jgi:hypothetical protein